LAACFHRARARPLPCRVPAYCRWRNRRSTAAGSADDDGQLPRLSGGEPALSPRHGPARRGEYGAELPAERHLAPSLADLSTTAPALASSAYLGATDLYRCRLTFPPLRSRPVAAPLPGRPSSTALLAAPF